MRSAPVRDDLRTRSGAASAAFRREEGAEQPESVARTAQMITHPEGQTRSLCPHSLPAAQPHQKRTAGGRRDEEDAACRERIWNTTCNEL